MILINSSPQDALKIFQPFLPIFMPIGMGCLVAACRAEGLPVRFVDEQVEEDLVGRIDELVKGLPRPYFFGFSVLTAAMKRAVETSRTIREKYPDSVIVFGGIHPSAVPDEVMAFEHIDYVLGGEGERSLVELYRSVMEGGDVSQIGGLSWRKDGKVVHNPRSCEVVDIEQLPPFPYDLFADNDYDLGFIASSRGCPYNCIFCSNRVTTGKKYRFLSEEKTADILQKLHDEYGQKFVIFLDDNLLVSKQRIYKLIEAIKAKGLHEKMTFSFQARGDNVDRQLLTDLYAAGFRSVFFGLETASERLMEIVKKGETVAQCVEAVKMAKEIGFHVSGTFIFGLPTETHEDRMESIRLAKALRLDQVRFNNATPYPGTELFDIARSQMRLSIHGIYENFLSVGTFIENPFDRVPFSYVPEGSTEEEIRNDILFAYLALYWDMDKLKEIFLKPKQGAGWFNAGESLVKFLRKIPALAALFGLMSVKFFMLFLDVARGKNTKLKGRDLITVLLGRFSAAKI